MGRNIVIVGNGSAPPCAAAMIDSSDLVIRFNDCRSFHNTGTRTDIVAVCNTGRPARAMTSSPLWQNHPAVSSASTIWCVRNGQKFRELRDDLRESHPELDDFCDDMTPDFAAFAAATGKALTVIPRDVHDRLDRDLARVGTQRYVVPSSGLLAIGYVLDEIAGPDDTIHVTGFDHQGWDGHPFDAERRLVNMLVASGRLNRLPVHAGRRCA